MIAHRLSTIRNADQIAVISKGVVVEKYFAGHGVCKAKLVKTIFLDRLLGEKGVDFRLHIHSLGPHIETLFTLVLPARALCCP